MFVWFASGRSSQAVGSGSKSGPAVTTSGDTDYVGSDACYQAGLAALAERKFRREGLAVSLVFILFLAALVYLKIRQIESRQPASE